MDEAAIKATVAGVDGEIVGADEAGIHWEAEVPTEELTAFIARCSRGAELHVVVPEGRHRVMTRRWWVWPEESMVRVRLLLEDAVAS